MAIGDVTAVTVGDCTVLYYVDTGMYDVHGYGAVYILDGDRPAIVDTGIGTDHERILSALREVGIDPVALEVLAVTHVHLDHAGGAGYLVESCPNATVYVHEIGAPHLADPARLWAGTKQAVGEQIAYYAAPEPVPDARLVELADGDSIGLGDRELTVHHVPGHAPHQVVFHDERADALFTADAAGIYAPETDALFPTSPPPNFDPEQCQHDVETLQALDPTVLCYAHFGAVAAGDRFQRYSDVLADWVESIRERRTDLEDDAAVVESFVDGADDERALWGTEKAEAEVAMNVRGVLGALDAME